MAKPLKVGSHSIEISSHFRVQGEKKRRLFKGRPQLRKFLEESVIVTASHPRNVERIIDKGFKESIYLYHPSNRIVFVGTTNDNGDIVLITLFRATEDDWVWRWYNREPKPNLIKFINWKG